MDDPLGVTLQWGCNEVAHPFFRLFLKPSLRAFWTDFGTPGGPQNRPKTAPGRKNGSPRPSFCVFWGRLCFSSLFWTFWGRFLEVSTLTKPYIYIYICQTGFFTFDRNRQKWVEKGTQNSLKIVKSQRKRPQKAYKL